MAIAAKEVGQAKNVAVLLAADDDRTGAGLDQADATQDQRAHQPLAEIGLGNQQGAQPVGRDRDRLDVGQRLLVDQIGTAGKLGELAHEIATFVDDDLGLLAAVRPGHLDLAGQDQDQARTGLADARQHLTGAIAARLPEAGEPLDLVVVEAQEHLVAARRVDLPPRITHERAGSARKDWMASITAFGCSSISQCPELAMLRPRT